MFALGKPSPMELDLSNTKHLLLSLSPPRSTLGTPHPSKFLLMCNRVRSICHLRLPGRIRQHARPPLMLLRLLVINKKLAALAIASWLIAGDLDDGEVGVAFAEDRIHFFQGAAGRFGVEEVDYREDESVTVDSSISWSL